MSVENEIVSKINVLPTKEGIEAIEKLSENMVAKINRAGGRFDNNAVNDAFSEQVIALDSVTSKQR